MIAGKDDVKRDREAELDPRQLKCRQTEHKSSPYSVAVFRRSHAAFCAVGQQSFARTASKASTRCAICVICVEGGRRNTQPFLTPRHGGIVDRL